jgi:hypothetical protein
VAEDAGEDHHYGDGKEDPVAVRGFVVSSWFPESVDGIAYKRAGSLVRVCSAAEPMSTALDNYAVVVMIPARKMSVRRAKMRRLNAKDKAGPKG